MTWMVFFVCFFNDTPFFIALLHPLRPTLTPLEHYILQEPHMKITLINAWGSHQPDHAMP